MRTILLGTLVTLGLGCSDPGPGPATSAWILAADFAQVDQGLEAVACFGTYCTRAARSDVDGRARWGQTFLFDRTQLEGGIPFALTVGGRPACPPRVIQFSAQDFAAQRAVIGCDGALVQVSLRPSETF